MYAYEKALSSFFSLFECLTLFLLYQSWIWRYNTGNVVVFLFIKAGNNFFCVNISLVLMHNFVRVWSSVHVQVSDLNLLSKSIRDFAVIQIVVLHQRSCFPHKKKAFDLLPIERAR